MSFLYIMSYFITLSARDIMVKKSFIRRITIWQDPVVAQAAAASAAEDRAEAVALAAVAEDTAEVVIAAVIAEECTLDRDITAVDASAV